MLYDYFRRPSVIHIYISGCSPKLLDQASAEILPYTKTEWCV